MAYVPDPVIIFASGRGEEIFDLIAKLPTNKSYIGPAKKERASS